jgi:hypothetical protein
MVMLTESNSASTYALYNLMSYTYYTHSSSMTESKGAPVSFSRLRDLYRQANIQLPERKKWDKSEWEAKAKEKDAKYREQAIEAEKSMAKGQSLHSHKVMLIN